MNGEAAAATIEVLVQNLINLSKEEISRVLGLEKNAEKLKKTLAMIQSFLDDADQKLITQNSVKAWLKELEDVSFDADNVLDQLSYRLLSKRMKREKKKKVPSCFPNFNHYLNRRHLVVRVEEINTSFESINKRATELGLVSMLETAHAAPLDAAPGTNSFTLDPIFIGRENDVSKIVEIMTTSRTEKPLSILPIVGMGGLGKTTLTRTVFHHEKIKAHFAEQIWVHVSRSFDSMSLLKEILTTLTSQKVEVKSSEVILKKLLEAFQTKTYLLVLDDVWNQERDKWQYFTNSLSGVSPMKGNGIIVTTRITEVASIVQTLPIYDLRGLSDETCWSIIKEIAFGGGDVAPGFEDIGREIAERCRGLPLAANIVGGGGGAER